MYNTFICKVYRYCNWYKGSYGEPRRVKETGIIATKALIGLLMLAGAYHSNRLNLVDA